MAGHQNSAEADPEDVVISLRDTIALLGGFPALSGLSLDVKRSDILHVKGPNGAGKTTLLSLCAGLAAPHSGSAYVLGYDLTTTKHRRIVRRLVGIFGHETGLYSDLTVAENLRFWARANKVDDSMVKPTMTRLGLSGRLENVLVRNLSHGQQRRTALAVLVIRRPRLWLMDEPYLGLDPSAQIVVDELMKSAVDFGATVVFTSHDAGRAGRVATKTLELRGGRKNAVERLPSPVGVVEPFSSEEVVNI